MLVNDKEAEKVKDYKKEKEKEAERDKEISLLVHYYLVFYPI